MWRAILVLPLAVLLAGVRDARACTCLETAPACEVLWKSALVFSGQVLDVTPVPNQHGPQFFPERRVRFRIEKMWRGDAAAEVYVMTGAGSGDCGYDFKPGESYLVYTYWRAGVPWTGTCGRTRRLADAAADVAYLVTSHEPRGGATVFGNVEYSRGSGSLRSRPATGYAISLSGNGRTWRTTTDARGRYEFSQIPVGRYSIAVGLHAGQRAYGLPPDIEIVDTRGCASANFGLGGTGSVSLQVLNSDREPASGIQLELIDADTLQNPLPSYRGARTDASGRITFTEIPPGRYVVVLNLRTPPSAAQPYWRFFHPGTSDVTSATYLSVATGLHVEAEPLILPAPLSSIVLKGSVSWPDGTAARSVFVTALPVNTVHFAADTRSDSTGQFSLPLLEGVSYTITATAYVGTDRAMWLAKADVQVRGDPEPLILRLQPYKR